MSAISDIGYFDTMDLILVYVGSLLLLAGSVILPIFGSTISA